MMSMAYIVRFYPKGRGSSLPREIVTPACSTAEEALSILHDYLKDLGVISDPSELSPDEVVVEYEDMPYVYIEPRDWKGNMSKLYGMGYEQLRRLAASGGSKAIISAYLTMIDPKVPLEKKVALYSRIWGGGKGSSSKSNRRRVTIEELQAGDGPGA